MRLKDLNESKDFSENLKKEKKKPFPKLKI